jgi:Tfp pilus assembly protein PilV
MKKRLWIKGLSITEVLVAFTIFLIALLAVVQLFYQSI